MKRGLILFLAALSFRAVTGQEKPIELETATVTATLHPSHFRETGRNITIIKGELIRQLPVNSVDELLRYLPGVEVQQRGPQGSQGDIIIRGGTFQQVLVIIDGVKLNDPLTGHFSGYIPIHPAEIERIEILKGASSAIYGSEAVGGVVHIITKTFSGSDDKRDNGLQAGIQASEYKLLNANAYAGFSNARSKLAGGFITNNAGGQPLRGTRSFFHLTTANLSFSRRLGQHWRFSARGAADFRYFNAQNYYTTFASDTARENVDAWWGQINLRKKTEKSSLNIDAGYKSLRDQYWFRPGLAPNDNKSALFTAQAYYHTAFSKVHSVTGGVQLQHKKIRSNDRGNHTLWHGAAYAIFHQQWPSKLSLHESIRLDADESYGWVLVPQLNLGWSPNRFTLRFSAGRSIRDADFTERYNNYNKALVTSGRIGNPNLGPEASWNLEAGIDYYANSGWKLTYGSFYRRHRNLIDWAPTAYANMPRQVNLSPSGSYALARNVEQVNTRGLELEASYNKKWSPDRSLSVMAGLTLMQSSNDDSIPSFYIASHANVLASFSVAWQHRSFSLSVNGLYKQRDRQEAAAIKAVVTPSYFVMNTKLGWRLPARAGMLFVQADNVFDKDYSDLLGSPMPGRWLSAGIDIRL